MAQVSEAERWVNEYCGQSFTSGSEPDGVVSATLNMARYYMNQQMLVDGYIKELPVKLSIVKEICKTYLESNKVTPDYTGSDDLFHLPTLRG